MNVKFLNPFVEAAFEVLQAETGLQITRGELGLDKHAYVTEAVTVILSLVGAVEGTVFYSMAEATGVGLASRMMGETMAQFDTLAQSGVAELGNVITGRASVKLSEAGYEANISPPTLLCGAGATISTFDFVRLTVPLSSECGTVTIHLALREGVQKAPNAAALPVPARPTVTSL